MLQSAWKILTTAYAVRIGYTMHCKSFTTVRRFEPAISRGTIMNHTKNIKIIELKESILEDNDKDADRLRRELRDKNCFLINLMSSPGSGKTTTLLALNEAFDGRLKWGVMEADIDSSVDAETMQAAGIPAIQLHTGGMCHLDADMTRQGIRSFENAPDDLDNADGTLELIVLENIGNLVCPAEFDTGAHLNMTILSVPEGDDKPLKYPLMYEVADIMVINKIDAMSVFDFNREEVEEEVKKLNPDMRFFYISALTGEGIDELAEYILELVKEAHRNGNR